MRYKLFAIFLFTASAIVPAAVSAWNCSGLCSREMRCGKGIGADDKEADKNAKLAIADAVKSSISGIAHDILSVEEKNGEPDEFVKYFENTVTERELKNASGAKLACRYDDAYGNVAAEWYIYNSDAAIPYLTSFGTEVGKYSNLAIKIAEEKDSQKRNELLVATEYIKENAKLADEVLIPLVRDGVSAQISQEYHKLKKDFKAAEKKIELASRMVYDADYNLWVMPLIPFGAAQFYKGHYGRGVLFLASEAALLAAGGIYWGSYKDAVQKYNNSSNLNEKNELLQKSKGYKSDRESAEKTAFTAFGLAALVYLGGVVEGYYTDPATPRWHLTALPVPSQNGTGMALAFTGNF